MHLLTVSYHRLHFFYPRKSEIKSLEENSQNKIIYLRLSSRNLFVCSEGRCVSGCRRHLIAFLTQFWCSAGLIAFPSIEAFSNQSLQQVQPKNVGSVFNNQSNEKVCVHQSILLSEPFPNSLIQKILNSSFLCGEEILPRQICCVTLFLFSHFFSFPRIKSESVWRHICCFHNPLWVLLQFVFIFLDD